MDDVAMQNRRTNSRQGHAVVEASLMAPWIFFLFVGVLDFGFYAYAAICTENAARAAALQTSTSAASAGDDVYACSMALPEMKSLPNARTLTTCAQTAGAVTAAQPLAVNATSGVDADGNTTSQVAVTYRSVPLIPIPGLLAGQITFTRSVTMRARS